MASLRSSEGGSPASEESIGRRAPDGPSLHHIGGSRPTWAATPVVQRPLWRCGGGWGVLSPVVRFSVLVQRSGTLTRDRGSGTLPVTAPHPLTCEVEWVPPPTNTPSVACVPPGSVSTRPAPRHTGDQPLERTGSAASISARRADTGHSGVRTVQDAQMPARPN